MLLYLNRLRFPLAGLTVLGLIGSSLGCARLVCNDKVLASVKSPDGVLAAHVAERNCGATTDFSRVVVVQSSKESFAIDDDVVMVVKGQLPIEVNWKSDRHLAISCSCSRANTYRRVVILGDVDVSYE